MVTKELIEQLRVTHFALLLIAFVLVAANVEEQKDHFSGHTPML
jgi:hypothetical protein